VLTTSGHVVTETNSAESVFDAIAKERCDIILLDLQLPGMDGLDLVRMLKANPDTKAIPIVAVTAYAERYRRKDLLAAGCDAWIVKPIDTRTLASDLETAVAKKT
jgi:two-component system cell cycle response regulator